MVNEKALARVIEANKFMKGSCQGGRDRPNTTVGYTTGICGLRIWVVLKLRPEYGKLEGRCKTRD